MIPKPEQKIVINRRRKQWKTGVEGDQATIYKMKPWISLNCQKMEG